MKKPNQIRKRRPAVAGAKQGNKLMSSTARWLKQLAEDREQRHRRLAYIEAHAFPQQLESLDEKINSVFLRALKIVHGLPLR